MKISLNRILSVAVTLVALPVLAKLPPPTDEAKAKAAEAAVRTAWANKVADFKLCQSMDRVATKYRAAGMEAKPALPTPACVDPGPFVAAPK